MATKEIYKKLLVDKEEVDKKLVEKAEGSIGIDKENGETIILIPEDKLNDKEKISLYFIGKYFSNKIGYYEDTMLTIDELSDKVKMDRNILRARLSDLKKEEKIDSKERGKYQVIFTQIENMLDEIRRDE